MFDNRTTKTNPKAPDFKCRNATKVKDGPGCDGVIWPPKPGQRSPYAPPAAAKQEFSSGSHIPGLDAPQSISDAQPNVEAGSVYPRLQKLFSVYDVCLDHIMTNVAPKLNNSEIGTTPEAIAAMTATLFIAAK